MVVTKDWNGGEQHGEILVKGQKISTGRRNKFKRSIVQYGEYN
jgi:hypothetical protein